MAEEDKSRNEELDNASKIDGVLSGMTTEDFEKTFNKSMDVLLVLLFCGAVGVYLLLKAYVGLAWAELWMVVVYGWTLLSAIEAIAPKLKAVVKKDLRKTGNASESKQEDSIEADEADEAEDGD